MIAEWIENGCHHPTEQHFGCVTSEVDEFLPEHSDIAATLRTWKRFHSGATYQRCSHPWFWSPAISTDDYGRPIRSTTVDPEFALVRRNSDPGISLISLAGMVLNVVQSLLDTSFWRVFRLHYPVDFFLPFFAELIDEEMLKVLFLHLEVFDVAVPFNGGIPEPVFVVPKFSLTLSYSD